MRTAYVCTYLSEEIAEREYIQTNSCIKGLVKITTEAPTPTSPTQLVTEAPTENPTQPTSTGVFDDDDFGSDDDFPDDFAETLASNGFRRA
jgi:hypothetical protein